MNRFDVETRLIDLVTGFIPWLAPAPSAFLVGRATVKYLEWPDWVAAVAALIIEGLGITTVYMALTLWNFNQDKRKSDPSAPTWLAVLLAAVYLVATIGLTVLLDIRPDLAILAPALFPLLALVGAVNLALRSDHRRRLVAIATDKAQRSAAHHKPQITVSEPAPAALPKPAEDPKYTCPACGAPFQTSGAYASHMRWSHPKSVSVETP